MASGYDVLYYTLCSQLSTVQLDWQVLIETGIREEKHVLLTII